MYLYICICVYVYTHHHHYHHHYHHPHHHHNYHNHELPVNITRVLVSDVPLNALLIGSIVVGLGFITNPNPDSDAFLIGSVFDVGLGFNREV
jgi:hypothetical protein